MPQPMGLDGAFKSACIPRKFRFLMFIDDVSGTNSGAADVSNGVSVLPPMTSARPQLSFKEEGVQHLNEIIYYPMKPEFRGLPLTLFDVKTNAGVNPVFEWIRLLYDPMLGAWSPPIGFGFKKTAQLYLYSGCGDIIEQWTFDNAWPQDVNWGSLDMGTEELVTVEMTLRYDRAYNIMVGG